MEEPIFPSVKAILCYNPYVFLTILAFCLSPNVVYSFRANRLQMIYSQILSSLGQFKIEIIGIHSVIVLSVKYNNLKYIHVMKISSKNHYSLQVLYWYFLSFVFYTFYHL